jgi:uncharacterized membrane protein
MISDAQRQRVERYQQQRERYVEARRRAVQEVLIVDREPLSTRHRALPALLAAPFGILALAGALDLLYLATGNHFWTIASSVMIPVGVAGCVATAGAGLRDWFAAPPGSRARGVGVWFVVGTALVVTIFLQSWIARLGDGADPAGQAVVLGFMGAAVALLTGWLLGEYLDRLSVVTIRPTDARSMIVELAVVDDVSDPGAEQQAARA